jgi:hypothetical protein
MPERGQFADSKTAEYFLCVSGGLKQKTQVYGDCQNWGSFQLCELVWMIRNVNRVKEITKWMQLISSLLCSFLDQILWLQGTDDNESYSSTNARSRQRHCGGQGPSCEWMHTMRFLVDSLILQWPMLSATLKESRHSSGHLHIAHHKSYDPNKWEMPDSTLQLSFR